MKIGELCNSSVLAAEADETLADVASRMQFHEVSALPVYDRRTMVGIITERDLVRAAADDVQFKATEVAEYMTPEPVVVGPETSSAAAADLMLRLGTRHLPVVQTGRLIGMISARDLLIAVGDGVAPPREPAFDL